MLQPCVLYPGLVLLALGEADCYMFATVENEILVKMDWMARVRDETGSGVGESHAFDLCRFRIRLQSSTSQAMFRGSASEKTIES